jgi:hypothetical protein
MKPETEKQQRTRLAAGMLATHVKTRDEVRVILCPLEDVQPRVRAMSAAERAALTERVDWLADYEASEALTFGHIAGAPA